MKSFAVVTLLQAALAIAVTAQPTINSAGVVNVASYAAQGLPNSSIAQGSIFVIFGTGMGPASLLQTKSFPVQTTLGGTTVTILAGGQTLQAPIIYTVASQVGAVMPSTTPVGTATVTVGFNGASSAPQSVTVVSSSFGTFSVNQGGSGAGIITNANYQVFAANSSAKPGDAAIIWGTGLGPVPYSDAIAPTATNLTSIPVKLYVGGHQVNTVYQGRSPCCSGLDQIVFTVPGGVEGCSVSVTVMINDVVSNTTTMPITTSANRVCSDPNGFSSGDLGTLLSKGTFNIGYVILERVTSTNTLPPPFGGTTTSDFGGAGFFKFTPATFAGATGSFQQAAIGACVVYIYTGSSTGTSSGGSSVGLDAGPVINLSGPNGAKQLTPLAQLKGFYSDDLSGTPPNVVPYLDAGTYAINNGTGGADVQGFSFNLNVSQPLTWTNMSTISASPITRSQGVTVTWTGGSPGTYVTISGDSVLSGPPVISASFTCIAPVAAQTFTVGPDVLLQLPVSSVISEGGITISESSLSVGNSSNLVKFTAPGLDYAFAETSVSDSTTVTYK